ncbi:unnamed protein product [Allacma fusca]|uniref:C2H2-type domain-containing protein n=1 Tax=Allacma fusca TaxID=39272 RepID=A0A8J2KTM0_9HEXA|nr:unnamed protein product [Allacma fusca]
MSSPFRNTSYYKDTYDSSAAPAKRFHSTAGSSSHYYDGADDRKRHRLDAPSSQTSSRYNSSDYQHRASSSYMGKPASYYEGTSHRTASGKPSSSSALPPSMFRSKDVDSSSYSRSMSSSKYMDSASSASTSRRYDEMRSSKYPPRRIPPPLGSTGGAPSSSFSSRSKPTNGTVLPLMKLSVDSSSKEYYGSRYRQAPPEHHRDGGYNSYNSMHARNESRRPAATSNILPRRPFNASGNNFSAPRAYGKNLAAIRKATQITAASVTSRIRKRAAAVRPSRDRDRDNKRYYKDRNQAAAHRRKDRSRDKSVDSKDTEEARKRKRKSEKPDEDEDNDAESEQEEQGQDQDQEQEQEMEEEQGEEDGEENEGDGNKSGEELKDETVAKISAVTAEDTGDSSEKHDVVDTEDRSEEKAGTEDKSKDRRDSDKKSRERETSSSSKKDSKKSRRTSGHEKDTSSQRTKRDSEDKDDSIPHRALLKLKCHYCDVRCITFREFTTHLKSYQHTKAMNYAVADMRKKLNQLRSQQRDQQRKLEKSSSDKTLSDTTSYCRVCELNFRTDPTEHEANELHNQIKGHIYQKCEVCDIDFRIWKVYLYHMAALEHAKRVALLELQAREGRGELVQGTNLSEQELGLHLVEERQVLFCNVCSRYIPIRESIEESRIQHCTTFTHVKAVDDHYAHEERQKEKKTRLEKKAAEAASKEEEKKSVADDSVTVKVENVGESGECPDGSKSSDKQNDEGNTAQDVIIDKEPTVRVKSEAIGEGDNNEETLNERDEEEDEDEIELHAEVDDDGEEEESEETSTWSRRTRSSARKDSPSKNTVSEIN